MSNKFYTLNFDASHNNQSQTTGAGCIIRDNEGDMILAATYNLINCNVVVAKAVALRNGLRLAQHYNIKVGLIKGDNKEFLDLLVQETRGIIRAPQVPLSDIVSEIRGVLYQMNINPLSQIQLIGQDSNKVANKLAILASGAGGINDMIYTRDADLPYEVTKLVRQEKSSGSIKEEDSDKGSSTFEKFLNVTGFVIAGAKICHTLHKFLNRGSNDEEHKEKAKTTQTNIPTSSQSRGSFCTLNFVSSKINQFTKAGAGCIIREKQGNFVIAATYNIGNYYPDSHVAIADAIALRNGLNLAKANNVKLDLIQGDNKELIDRVLGRETKPSTVPLLNTIIQEIKYALHEQSINPESQLKLIQGGVDKVAEKLAFLGSTSQQMIYTRFEDLPIELAILINQDRLNGVL